MDKKYSKALMSDWRNADTSGKRNQYYWMQAECVVCGKEFKRARITKKTCSDKCRKALSRQNKKRLC